MEVTERERFAATHGGSRGANQHAVHRHAVAGGQVARCEFVFRGNVGHKLVAFAAERDGVALPQVGEGNQHIVARIELKEFLQV